MFPWSATPATVAVGQRLGIDEWIALPEDAPGELVDGRLTEEEVPDPVHELAGAWLIGLFRGWLGPRTGFVFGSEVKLVVSPTRGRKADVSVYFPDRPPPPRRGALREPPDVIVEVVSPSAANERRDRVDKMDEYAAFGAPFYWLVDPALGSLEIFELENGRYARVVGATGGRLGGVPGCPGMELDLDDLWAELARLAHD